MEDQGIDRAYTFLENFGHKETILFVCLKKGIHVTFKYGKIKVYSDDVSHKV